MKLKSLQELGELKNRIINDRDIIPLEGIINSYLENEGLANFREISARKIASEIYRRGYENLDKLYGFLNDPALERSKGGIIWYSRSFQKHLEDSNYPLEASLGLALICDDLYRKIKLREEVFHNELEEEIAAKKTEIRELGGCIAGMERSFRGKVNSLLGRVEGNFISRFINKLFLSKFHEEYELIIKQKVEAERISDRKKGALHNRLENYFYPIRTQLAFVFGDITRRVLPTEFGPFRNNMDIAKILRKRSVELMMDNISICNDPEALSYLKSDIYKYTLLLQDNDPEKISLLEEGLKYARMYLRHDDTDKDKFKLSSYLCDLFIVRYVQEKKLDFELFDESYEITQEIMMNFKDNAYQGQNVQLLMHIFNNQLLKLNNFLHNDVNPNDFEIINKHCTEHGFSFHRLYNKFSSVAVKFVPIKYSAQYRKNLDFKGI
ncbi:hypothetical protein HYV89_01060 [Candidatus Woesearchaeota archaeon]|nr:hypothetical protein [Candidatus Woesearchaeota archaeon]